MATAVLIGLGGLGCPAAVTLAEAGVDLRLVDDDVVELSNLQRQVLYGTSDVGRPKVEVARERLAGAGLEVHVDTARARLTADACDDLLGGADVVVDATDDPRARFLINDWALAHGVPAVLGGITRYDGLVLGVGAGGGPCFRCLFEAPPADDEVQTCVAAGVIGALAGLVGHLEAERALGLLAGDERRHTGYLTTVDGRRGRVRHVHLPADPECPACRRRPSRRAAPPRPSTEAAASA
ncbi:MAG: HesA/MoeB/ThiF family protein [Deltaproteobacteria bacterium]|nr:HesA/MoeB/ThiF family protein [Deltaproteobacteria bacterium]